MPKLRYSNVQSAAQADFVIMGVPDESGSHADRKGTNRGPDAFRKALNSFEFFERNGKLIPTSPMSGSLSEKAIFDIGNVKKKDLRKTVNSLALQNIIPVCIGGDHSITTEAVKGVAGGVGSKLAICYFDAHPDFVSSSVNYYGSVLTDCAAHLDFGKSALVGTRAAEQEELENSRRHRVTLISPLDISRNGLAATSRRIAKTARGARIYVSIDLDCLDPAFAPGVSLPSPCGLSSIELVYLLKELIATGNVCGLDIVELCPDYDVHQSTAALSAKILSECLASFPRRIRPRRNQRRAS